MVTNVRLLWILAGFFFFAAALYTTWSLLDAPGDAPWQERVEWVGTVAITLSGILAILIAFYLRLVIRSQGGTLPEDRLDAHIDDGEAEQGHFSPWSWWPIVLAFSSALVFLGLAIGLWISFIGAGIVVIAIVGWVYEYYRGNFAR